jgi:hypothetical protein
MPHAPPISSALSLIALIFYFRPAFRSTFSRPDNFEPVGELGISNIHWSAEPLHYCPRLLKNMGQKTANSTGHVVINGIVISIISTVKAFVFGINNMMVLTSGNSDK